MNYNFLYISIFKNNYFDFLYLCAKDWLDSCILTDSQASWNMYTYPYCGNINVMARWNSAETVNNMDKILLGLQSGKFVKNMNLKNISCAYLESNSSKMACLLSLDLIQAIIRPALLVLPLYESVMCESPKIIHFFCT